MARTDATDYVVTPLEGPFAGVSLPLPQATSGVTPTSPIQQTSAANAPGPIVLSGRSLPYRAGAGGSISFGRHQRTKTQWYAGNDVATQLVFGSILKPTTINGTWKDRYIRVEGAIDLVEAFDSLCAQGVQVRVEWETIVRVGVISDFDWQPGNPTGGLDNITWTCIFEWNAANALPPPRRVNQADLQVQDDLADVVDQFSATVTAVQGFSNLYSSFVALTQTSFANDSTNLNNQLTLLKSSNSILQDQTQKISINQNLPARLVENLSGAVGTGSDRAYDLATLIEQLQVVHAVPVDDIVQVLAFENARRALLEQLYAVIIKAYRQRVRLEQLARPDEFARYPAIAGQDLRRIANIFYGDPDKWIRIAKANGITTSVVPPDVSELVIPLSVPDSLDNTIVGVT